MSEEEQKNYTIVQILYDRPNILVFIGNKGIEIYFKGKGSTNKICISGKNKQNMTQVDQLSMS